MIIWAVLQIRVPFGGVLVLRAPYDLAGLRWDPNLEIYSIEIRVPGLGGFRALGLGV